MRACAEPIRTGIGAVCVEYGWPKWPITMLNHTDIPGTESCLFFIFGTLCSYDPLWRGVLPKGKKRPRSLRALALTRYNGKCRLPCSVYRCLSGSGNCLTLFCLLLLFQQFVVVRIRFFVYDCCHSFFFSLDFLFVRSSCVVFHLFNARGLLVCAWTFFSYPVGWHGVALFTLLNALQWSISMSNCCDHSVRISVK